MISRRMNYELIHAIRMRTFIVMSRAPFSPASQLPTPPEAVWPPNRLILSVNPTMSLPRPVTSGPYSEVNLSPTTSSTNLLRPSNIRRRTSTLRGPAAPSAVFAAPQGIIPDTYESTHSFASKVRSFYVFNAMTSWLNCNVVWVEWTTWTIYIWKCTLQNLAS